MAGSGSAASQARTSASSRRLRTPPVDGSVASGRATPGMLRACPRRRAAEPGRCPSGCGRPVRRWRRPPRSCASTRRPGADGGGHGDRQGGRPRRPPPGTARRGTLAEPVTPEVPEVPEVPAGVAWLVGDEERRCGLVLALDAVNFGSGWHPLLRKRVGLSGARTVATAFTEWWIDLAGPVRHSSSRSSTVAMDPAAPCWQRHSTSPPAANRADSWRTSPQASPSWPAGSSTPHDGRWSCPRSRPAARPPGSPAPGPAPPLGRPPGTRRPARLGLYKRAQIAAADWRSPGSPRSATSIASPAWPTT